MKQDPIVKISSPNDSIIEQPCFTLEVDSLDIKRNVVLETEVIKDILIIQDSTIAISKKKEFIQDFEVEGINVEDKVLSISSLEKKNVTKSSFEKILNKHEVSNKEVQSILDLSFMSNDMVKTVQQALGEKTTIVLEGDKVDIVLSIIHGAKQIVLEELI